MTVSKTIVLAGAAHIDRTGRLNERSSLHCSNPGWFDETVGGTSLNVASILASLGSRSKLITQLGDDMPAKQIRFESADRGIELIAFSPSAQNTGTYTSVLEPDGNLLIALADMAIYDNLPDHIVDKALVTANESDIFCVDANLPEATINKLLECSAQFKVAFTVSKAKASKLRSSIGSLDLLFSNRVEMAALMELPENWQSDAMVEKLSVSGIKSCVISNGAEDVFLWDGKGVLTLPVEPKQKVVDVTGAGDGLAAGTLHALNNGAPLAKAVQFGIRVANAIIDVPGPWRPDLRESVGHFTNNQLD